MKKFFKIIGIVIGVVLVLIIGLGIYANVKGNKVNKYRQELAQRVESFKSTDSDEYMEYSVSINKGGDFNKGFQYLNKAVELNPKSHLGYRGWMRLRKLRDYDKALIDFDKLDSLTPNFVDAPWGENIDFLRGECYFGKKDYEKAIQMFNRNIENQKEDWADIYSFVYLGLCEYELGNYENAIKEYQRGLNQFEHLCEAYYGMAKAYYKLGNLEEAKINVLKAEVRIQYKRKDVYNEFLNEIYIEELLEFKENLNKHG